MLSIIRAVRKDDREHWEQLFQAYADFYQVELPEKAREAAWAWIFSATEDFWCDVVESDDGQLLGFVQYQLMHRSLSGEKVCYLQGSHRSGVQRGP